MSPVAILFLACAALAVVGAVALILLREPIHSALALVVVMASLAVIYLLLGAEFVAAVQVIVYAGAIMVLFVFVIMLLNAREEQRTNVSRIARWVGVPLALLFLVHAAFWMVFSAHGRSIPDAHLPASTTGLAVLLFRDYVFPFELTSILILVAVLGAVALAKKEF